ncbi:MAG: hypothetical protein PHD31_00135 [Candidatus Pacebacteria bacterium]|nr:hypothetical protein [Candidatus Paceibacterota bacterium]
MEDQAHQKLLRYLDDYIDSDKFHLKVGILRKKFAIPANGLPLSKTKNDLLVKNGFDPFYIPEQIKNISLRDINRNIKERIKDFPIENQIIFCFLRLYIFYNKKFYSVLSKKIPGEEANLCIVERVKFDIEELTSGLPSNEIVKIFERNFKDYPVAIKLHPSISSKDLISYIKKNWQYIKFLLGDYEDINSRIGKTRKRNPLIKERNSFIYQNRHLPHKEIYRIAVKKFPDISKSIDQGSIGKIISIERKRRKQLEPS